MKFTFSALHQSHAPESIVLRGANVQSLEVPARALRLRDTLQKLGHTEVPVRDWGMRWISAVHDLAYLEFLSTAHERWVRLPNAGSVVYAHAHPHRSLTTVPSSIQGQAGYFLGGGSAPMTAGTWRAAISSAHCALEAAQWVLEGERETYALCRPPGHHAYRDYAGGFCYLNNVAIAANFLAKHMNRVAIFDIDTHHGDGTQSIFYERDDVHFVSVHGNPDELFPFYAGYANERGRGIGEGFTLNLPLALKSEDPAWLSAVHAGMRSIDNYSPAVLLVSLGFDAFKGDPSSDLCVSTEGFRSAGKRIGAWSGPIVLVQEGGYVVDKLPENLSAFLDGFFQSRNAT